jgi:hypothetical protein
MIFCTNKEITCIFADTRLAQELQKFELSQRAEGKHRVIEWSNLLDGDLATRRAV